MAKDEQVSVRLPNELKIKLEQIADDRRQPGGERDPPPCGKGDPRPAATEGGRMSERRQRDRGPHHHCATAAADAFADR